ncbi:hypothetical protein NC652_034794 [Populus alba x Populus x berolinensis]|nr:hypothetical protein NC652_034794 [Populus alba x Populus x berolinensis]
MFRFSRKVSEGGIFCLLYFTNLLILISASHHDLSLEMDGGLICTLLREERFKGGILPLGRIPRDCSIAPCHDGFQPLFTKVLVSAFQFLHQKSWVCGLQFVEKYYDVNGV